MTIRLPAFEDLEGYHRDPFRSFYNSAIYQSPYEAVPAEFPRLLDIEINNHCNFDCLFCYRNKMRRKEAFMSLALFRRIIDEGAAHGLSGIRICGWGEPFMHRDIYEMIHYAREKDILVHVTTNGSLLINEENRKKLLDSGCNKIKLSLQGADGAGYEIMRNNKLYPKIVAAILALVDERDLVKNDIFIQVGTSFTDETIGQRQAFFSFWMEKVDHVYGDNTHLEHVKDMDRVKAMNIHLRPVYRKKKFSRCGRPQSMMFISSNGSASFCCSDYNMENVIGDVNLSDIRSIWQGGAMNCIRDILENAKERTIPICANCYTQR